jgi:hypothetical protein
MEGEDVLPRFGSFTPATRCEAKQRNAYRDEGRVNVSQVRSHDQDRDRCRQSAWPVTEIMVERFAILSKKRIQKQSVRGRLGAHSERHRSARRKANAFTHGETQDHSRAKWDLTPESPSSELCNCSIRWHRKGLIAALRIVDEAVFISGAFRPRAWAYSKGAAYIYFARRGEPYYGHYFSFRVGRQQPYSPYQNRVSPA